MRGKCLSDLTPAKSFSTDSHEARDCTGGMSSISRRWFRLASARSGVSSLHVSRDSDAPIEPAPRSRRLRKGGRAGSGVAMPSAELAPTNRIRGAAGLDQAAPPRSCSTLSAGCRREGGMRSRPRRAPLRAMRAATLRAAGGGPPRASHTSADGVALAVMV